MPLDLGPPYPTPRAIHSLGLASLHPQASSFLEREKCVVTKTLNLLFKFHYFSGRSWGRIKTQKLHSQDDKKEEAKSAGVGMKEIVGKVEATGTNVHLPQRQF